MEAVGAVAEVEGALEALGVPKWESCLSGDRLVRPLGCCVCMCVYVCVRMGLCVCVRRARVERCGRSVCCAGSINIDVPLGPEADHAAES